ncbi:MAG TPA: hypothetical protein ENK85_07845 [Saprospiraceae bacterium]|nr:hypothetical protein [Saprospiraceae bacterium]
MKSYLRKKAGTKLNALFAHEEIVPNSLLIIFDSTKPTHEKIIRQWLKDHQSLFSKTMLIGVDAKNNAPKATIFPIIGKKDIAWYDMVKREAAQRVKPDFSPDFLLVLRKQPMRAIDELVAKIPANLKVTHRPFLQNVYNLVLDSRGDDWAFLLQELDAILPKVELV